MENLGAVLLDRVEALKHVTSDERRAATGRLNDTRVSFRCTSSVFVVVEDGDNGSVSPASCDDEESARDSRCTR